MARGPDFGKAKGAMSANDLGVLVIDAGPAARTLVTGLAAGGGVRVETAPLSPDLLPRIEAIAPDVIVIALEDADAAVVEAVLALARAVARPLAVFTDRSTADATAAAVEAGVAAWVVDGLQPARLRPVLDTAIARHRSLARLRRERDEAVSALAARKTIERAKGILMRERAMTEEEAYTALRKTAMKQGRRIVDIAESVIVAAGVTG